MPKLSPTILFDDCDNGHKDIPIIFNVTWKTLFHRSEVDDVVNGIWKGYFSKIRVDYLKITIPTNKTITTA